MKQYDSYLIYGCHFPSLGVEIILANSSLKFFNNKIKDLYNCEIIQLNIPINDEKCIKQYFLKINVEQSEQGIIKLENIKDIDITKFKEVMEMFEIDAIEPYMIAVPICRDLPNYI